jgi:hypothetical protein
MSVARAAGSVTSIRSKEGPPPAFAKVGEQTLRVLVEVKERPRPDVEYAPLLLDQAGQGPELDQQVLQAIQVLGPRVPHGLPLKIW